MATSGSKDFELDVADYVEEAFERCGLELRTGYDLKTAQRSLNLMLAEWANRGLNQWTVKEKTVAMYKTRLSTLLMQPIPLQPLMCLTFLFEKRHRAQRLIYR